MVGIKAKLQQTRFSQITNFILWFYIYVTDKQTCQQLVSINITQDSQNTAVIHKHRFHSK